MATATTVVNSAEAANRLGIRVQTLRKWRYLGTGPRYIRYGGLRGRVVYRPEDLEAFLEGRIFNNTTEETVHHEQTA